MRLVDGGRLSDPAGRPPRRQCPLMYRLLQHRAAFHKPLGVSPLRISARRAPASGFAPLEIRRPGPVALFFGDRQERPTSGGGAEICARIVGVLEESGWFAAGVPGIVVVMSPRWVSCGPRRLDFHRNRSTDDEDVVDSPIRWGILGTGGIASTFVTDLRLTDSGVAVAVGSRSRGSADRFADEFGIASRHASYESLVADADVDVIYIAVPHPMHHDNAILALRAGKHVLVEKPFTMNAAEAREIVRVARENGLFAMEAMWTRFLPHVAVIRDWLGQGVLGDVVAVTADHGQWFAEDAEFRLFAPELGGGALLDLGVYPVSFASMVLGTPRRIVSLSEPAFTGVDAQTSMLFGYDSGAHAVLTCTLRAKSPTTAVIVGREARIEVEGDFYAPTTVTLVPREGDSVRVESVQEGRGLHHQANEVARRLDAGDVESSLMPLDETISIMETMDTVLTQARQNAWTTTSLR
jgi:predicted dehydrogenase